MTLMTFGILQCWLKEKKRGGLDLGPYCVAEANIEIYDENG
jgi:hypothetical protein